MRLIPGTRVVVELDGEERRFTLVTADGDGDGRLNVDAPLAVLLGAMALGDFAKAEMPLDRIETVLWGKAENRRGNYRSAIVMATAREVKSFERLTEEQATWLTRFVREAMRNAG